MDILTPVNLLGIALLVAIAVAGAFAYKLHRAGVANAAIPGQVALKAGDLADTLRDKIVAVFAEESAKLAANVKLKDGYYDVANFIQDLGRLPPTFTQAVSLKPVDKEAKNERDGTLPPLQYAVQPNGNVLKVAS